MLKIANKIKIPLTPRIFVITIFAIAISACGGTNTFNDYARAGDTVAVAGGFQPDFALSNISVQVKQNGPGGPVAVSYPQGDPAIRASINFYADPLSSMIVSRETGVEQTEFADTYTQTIDANYTFGDKDWFQTTVFVDLPTNLTVGTLYKVIVSNTQGQSFQSLVEIIAGTGTPSSFAAQGQELGPVHIAAVSRVPHYVVTFDATTVPHAIELTLSHDADSTIGGTGNALAMNPNGIKKNLAWTDDGNEMKVILTAVSMSGANAPDNILDYKFYVAGGINNLSAVSVSAYDLNGVLIPGGISASTVVSN